MKKTLPFISIDAGLYFNLIALMVVLSRLATNSKGRHVLEFERLQYFLYLVKNPARIEYALKCAGKKVPFFDSRYTHTIESLSSNVDILFYREKIRALLARVAALGFLSSDAQADGGRIYYLTDDGEIFLQTLIEEDLEAGGYVSSLVKFSDGISSLQSLALSRLGSVMNQVFKEEIN